MPAGADDMMSYFLIDNDWSVPIQTMSLSELTVRHLVLGKQMAEQILS